MSAAGVSDDERDLRMGSKITGVMMSSSATVSAILLFIIEETLVVGDLVDSAVPFREWVEGTLSDP